LAAVPAKALQVTIVAKANAVVIFLFMFILPGFWLYIASGNAL
jgi:hypothetical protein